MPEIELLQEEEHFLCPSVQKKKEEIVHPVPTKVILQSAKTAAIKLAYLPLSNSSASA